MIEALNHFSLFLENNRKKISVERYDTTNKLISQLVKKFYESSLEKYKLYQNDILLPKSTWIEQASVKEIMRYVELLEIINNSLKNVYEAKKPLDQLLLKTSIYESGKLNLSNLEQLESLYRVVHQSESVEQSSIISIENLNSFLKTNAWIHLLRPIVFKRLSVNELNDLRHLVNRESVAQANEKRFIKVFDQVLVYIKNNYKIYVNEQMVNLFVHSLVHEEMSRFRLTNAILTVVLPFAFFLFFGFFTFLRLQSFIFNPNPIVIPILWRVLIYIGIAFLSLPLYVLIIKNRPTIRTTPIAYHILSIAYTLVIGFMLASIGNQNFVWLALFFGITLYVFSWYTYSLRDRNHLYFHLTYQFVIALSLMLFLVNYSLLENIILQIIFLIAIYGTNRLLSMGDF